MPNTPGYGFPYPALTDQPNGPGAFQGGMLAVEQTMITDETEAIVGFSGTGDVVGTAFASWLTAAIGKPAWATSAKITWSIMGIYETGAKGNGGWAVRGLLGGAAGELSNGISFSGQGLSVRMTPITWVENFTGLGNATSLAIAWQAKNTGTSSALRADPATIFSANAKWRP